METKTPQSTTPAQAKTTDLVKEKEKNIRTQVQNLVSGYLDKGTLHLPKDYSPDNAIHNAYLKLVAADGNPIQNCNPASVVSAFLNMILQGLDVSKDQCYFIPYGKNLTFQRSYHGDIALAKRVRPGITEYHEVVRKGDELVIEIMRGKKHIIHRTKPENLNNDITHAYCGFVDEATGEDLGVELMTIERIKQSWSMSKMYKENGNGTHQKFTDKMALRTVIRAGCLPIIRTASDAHLREAIESSEKELIKAEMDVELAENANGATIDLADYTDLSDQSQESSTEDQEQVNEAPVSPTDGLPASLD